MREGFLPRGRLLILLFPQQERIFLESVVRGFPFPSLSDRLLFLVIWCKALGVVTVMAGFLRLSQRQFTLACNWGKEGFLPLSQEQMVFASISPPKAMDLSLDLG